MSFGVTRATTASSPEEGLAIPEDDTTPDAPFVTVAQGDLEALDPDGAGPTDPLRCSQLRGLLREEQLVAAFAATSSELLQLS